VAEIKFNKLYDQLGLIDKKYYDSTFKNIYDPKKSQPSLEGKSGYEQMKAVYEAEQQVPKKGLIDSLNFFSSASAAEPNTNLGIGGIDMSNYYTPDQQALIFGDPNYFGNQQFYEGTNVPVATPFSDSMNEPMDIENFLGTSTPQNLGFIDNAPTIREAVAPIGITDRGRGMATPGTMGAYEMIGGQRVPLGDVLGKQMALEKSDFVEEPASRFGLGRLLSIAGLLTGSKPIKALAAIANRDRISKAAGTVKDKASSGLASLNKKLRGTNPDGSIRTQAQFEKAEAQRRVDKRVANMLDRKAKGKAYSQKNLNKLTTGGSKPGTYTARGAGSGGESRKIVCTMMNERYGFGSFRNKIWMKFHESYGPEYQKGYHAIFLPLVKIAKGEGKINTAVRKVLEHMGRHVTADMFKIMKGKKRDPLGRIYRAIFEPTCRIIGKIKSALGRG